MLMTEEVMPLKLIGILCVLGKEGKLNSEECSMLGTA